MVAEHRGPEKCTAALSVRAGRLEVLGNVFVSLDGLVLARTYGIKAYRVRAPLGQLCVYLCRGAGRTYTLVGIGARLVTGCGATAADRARRGVALEHGVHGVTLQRWRVPNDSLVA